MPMTDSSLSATSTIEPVDDIVVRSPSIKRIAVLVETSTSWGSLIVAGISDYARRHFEQTGERWMLSVDARGYFERQELPAWWKGDGVIARVTTTALAQQVRLAKLPCVNVSQIQVPGSSIQQVTSNQLKIGCLAAESLIRTGVRSFGYICPPKREHYTDEIIEAFSSTLAAADLPPPQVFDPDRILRSDCDPHDILEPLVRWLRSLPQPTGVMTWNFLGGHRLCEACYFAGLEVPKQVSVLSADHDQLISDISDPPLTCVDQGPREVGHVAAAELARLMAGGRVEPPKLIQPAGIIWKRSVITEHISDELVNEAIRFMEAHHTREIQIEEVCEHLSVSRRKLEQHFRRTIGHGPFTHIQRLRIRQASRLLAETNLLIKQIAQRLGFRNSEQLQRLLKAETGLTPLQYRDAHRRPTAASHAKNAKTAHS